MADNTRSQLAVVDMQLRLASAMPEAEMQVVAKNCSILLQSAQLLNLPFLLTEQYPQGLGATLPQIAALCTDIKPIEKLAFSCVQVPKFRQRLTNDRSQIILAGMEAHICILQTALDLIAIGKQVFVVEDAVISRFTANKQNALARLREAGVVITNTESVVFEWLGVAQGDAFKSIAKLIR
ncbi:MAG: isochorismatase family protein [Methylotenera sp.]|nr:isochorismatase family protein [Methylotenera sp.]